MSFILDALRKSEQERQQGHVPMVSSVPLAIPQIRMPVWVILLIGVLCLAVVGLGWLWWQARQASPVPSPAAAAVQTPEPITPAVPTGPPAISLSRLAETSSAASSDTAAAASDDREEPQQTEGAAAPAASTDPASQEPGPPTRGELLAQGIDVPPLDLQLHVYSAEAARRFVFLNGSRYTEGETLAAGPQVVEITADGVRMRQSGREFFLARN